MFDFTVLNEVFGNVDTLVIFTLQRKILVFITKFQFVIIHIIPFED